MQERPGDRARDPARARGHRQEHGRRAGAVRYRREHSHVALLDSVSRAIRRGHWISIGIQAARIFVRRHDQAPHGLPARQFPAAGVWSPALAQSAATELPIEPLRRMLVPTEPFPGLPQHLPMMIDMTDGWHFRQEGIGLILAWADPEETPGFKPDFDPAFIEK